MNRVRWGILGAGGIATTVGADIAASSSSKVRAVGSRDLNRARSLAEQLGAEKAYGRYDELLADPEVDIVYVATTHAQHHAAALAALRAGKSVLVEKPIALNARQAKELQAEAAARGLLCLEAMWTRLSPGIRAIGAILESGEIGEVRTLRADLSHAFGYDPAHRIFDPAVGGGALLDLGVYPAAVAWLLLGEPDTVQANATLAPTGVDETVSMWWTYADGLGAQLTCSAVSEGGSTATIVGTKGWIETVAPLYRTEEFTVCTAAGARTHRLPLPAGNGYGLQIAEVEHCLATERTDSDALPLAAAIGVLETLDEARRQTGIRYPDEEK